AIRAVFAGENGGRRNAILLNAAGAIAAGGHAEDLREGLELARNAVDSGTAAARLDELIAFTQAEAVVWWARSQTRSPPPAQPRSPRWNARRAPPATCGRPPIRPPSRTPSAGQGPRLSRSSSTSASAGRQQISLPRARLVNSQCSRRGSSRPKTSWRSFDVQEPTRSCSCSEI